MMREARWQWREGEEVGVGVDGGREVRGGGVEYVR